MEIDIQKVQTCNSLVTFLRRVRNSREVNLAQNSELPEPLRVTFRDEHRKRDLLQLPQTNLTFETSLELEEESFKTF